MANTAIYSVNAGDNVGFTVDAAISHPGPLSVWMSKAPTGTTAAEYDGSGDWFKVYELTTYEITSAGLQWATYIPGTSGIQNFTIDLPADLESGDYLLRAEHIALHAAEEFEGAQYYIGCAQLSLTSSGSGSPSPVASIPGEYTGYEAGLIIDIYYPIPTNYTAPGISTWPDACISHWPNLVDQTYYGLCYNSESLSLLSSCLIHLATRHYADAFALQAPPRRTSPSPLTALRPLRPRRAAPPALLHPRPPALPPPPPAPPRPLPSSSLPAPRPPPPRPRLPRPPSLRLLRAPAPSPRPRLPLRRPRAPAPRRGSAATRTRPSRPKEVLVPCRVQIRTTYLGI